MDKASLEHWIEQGLSLAAIGRRVGRDPSTVGYWVKKHGLEPVSQNRHAARGGISAIELRVLVEQDLSTNEISVRLGLSPSTVRFWLGRHGLETRRSARLRAGRQGRQAGRAVVQLPCARHGMTDFTLEGRGAYRCKRCRSERVGQWRRRAKAILVEEAGGRCRLCGYDRCARALEFHHLDPSGKDFGVGYQGVARALDRMRREAGKCVLLCSNCHAEVEAGITIVPASLHQNPG